MGVGVGVTARCVFGVFMLVGEHGVRNGERF